MQSDERSLLARSVNADLLLGKSPLEIARTRALTLPALLQVLKSQGEWDLVGALTGTQ